ncbi:MAG: hypothetical protein J6P05_03465 [Lachnospiraceae bacterium]|nr:hypothetical protein [Lachnospiraceae bacterium]
MKKIIALGTVIVLISLYIAAAVLSIINDPRAARFSFGCVVCTIALPIVIHLFFVLTNIRNGKGIFDETYSYKEKKDDPQNLIS